MALVVLALRGLAAVAVLTILVGEIPRLVSLALAVAVGLWSALLLAPQHAGSIDPTFPAAVHELVIGAALGVLAAIPLLAAAAAGRFVDIAATGRAHGSYTTLFGVLAAAVFVGIDGHVAFVTGIVDSHVAFPSAATTRPTVLAAIAHLVPSAIRLAIPWLVTAAVVQLALGVGSRLAGRASAHLPAATAVPAALVMITASLVAMLAIAFAAVMRGAL